MSSFQRKFHEWSATQKYLFVSAVVISILIILVHIFLFLASPDFTVTKTATIKSYPGLVYEGMEDIHKLDRVMPWKSVNNPEEKDPNWGKYYNRYRVDNRKVKLFIVKKFPDRCIHYRAIIDDIYTVNFRIRLNNVDSTHVHIRIFAQVHVPFYAKLFIPKYRHEISEHIDLALDRYRKFLDSTQNNYKLTMIKDTIPAPAKYVGLDNKIHTLDFSITLDKVLPKILIYTLDKNIKKPGSKPIALFIQRSKDTTHFIAGTMIKDTFFELRKPYKIFTIPSNRYKMFQLTGPYKYARAAVTRAIDTLNHLGYKFLGNQPYFYEFVESHTKFPNDPSKWVMNIYLPVTPPDSVQNAVHD